MEIEKLVEEEDGIDRRGFLKCMAWAGTGVLWSLHGGVLTSTSLSRVLTTGGPARQSDFSFVQISDSHIGFSKAANPDVVGTFKEAVAKIGALPVQPKLLLHTGDISHLSKPDEFDTVDQILSGAGLRNNFYVPGEHDVLDDGGKIFLERYGKGSLGEGWRSFDIGGIHFVGLVNVVNLRTDGLGSLGAEQLAWLQRDLAPLSSSTPIVVFAHIPLWSVYPDWGWGTGDAEQALSMLRRFGSVTVLNGHIHQTLQKVEGNITFHTAASTAFPQPKPGEGPSPGPMKVDPGVLRDLLGITRVDYKVNPGHLAIVDSHLSEPDVAASRVVIDNFTFKPASLTVSAGATVKWTNRDDIPHNIVSNDGSFQKSPVLDTDQSFSHRFDKAGRYGYFCGIHPHMKGEVVVG